MDDNTEIMVRIVQTLHATSLPRPSFILFICQNKGMVRIVQTLHATSLPRPLILLFYMPKNCIYQKKQLNLTMPDKFQNRYRIPSARAIWWDYGRNAGYFITICTRSRNCYFGNVYDGKMELSVTGEIAQSCWQEIPQHFPYVQLDSFVVMPNHVHGIIIINKPAPMHAPMHAPVQTLHATSLPPGIKNEYMASISPKRGTLCSIVRSYKSAVTKKVHFINAVIEWHERYYDSIIRDDQSWQIINDYILNNPLKWKDDKFYPQ